MIGSGSLRTGALSQELSYRQAVTVSGRAPWRIRSAGEAPVVVATLILASALILMVVAHRLWPDDRGLALGAAPIALYYVAVVVIALIDRRRRTIARARLTMLTAENGWTKASLPVLPSSRLLRTPRRAASVVRVSDDPRCVVGTSDDGSEAPDVAVLALPRRLPHIMVLSRSARDRRTWFRPQTIDMDLASTQFLSLEGDFDTYLRLYAPKGAERDALYLFSPDVMAAFVDHAPHVNAEICGDTLILSGPHGSLAAPDTDRWLATLGLVDALSRKVAQWGRLDADSVTLPLAPMTKRQRGANAGISAGYLVAALGTFLLSIAAAAAVLIGFE